MSAARTTPRTTSMSTRPRRSPFLRPIRRATAPPKWASRHPLGSAPRLEKTMRNTWKGMVLGALSGAAVGLLLDSIDRAARGANTAAHAARDAAARAGKGARERAIALVHDSAGLAQRAAKRAAERAAE